MESAAEARDAKAMDAVRRKAIHDAMVRLSDGDRSAFHVLLDELWPVIRSFAKGGVGDTADAEDVAQEVFLKLCSRIADFDRSRDGLSWAFGIVSYEVLTHRKRARRRREVNDDAVLEQVAHAGASADLALEQRELALAFEQAVGALTEADRLLLGVAQRDSPGPASPALRKRKQRALERLRVIWRSIHGEP